MTRSSVAFRAAMCCLVLVAGCEGPFTPKGPYSDKLVVYGILTNRSDTQYVRVYSTYNPPGVNPLGQTADNVLRGASIVVKGEAGSFQFQEKTTPRVDKSRYTDDLLVYASYPFSLTAGKTYNLNVSTREMGGVSAAVTVPNRGRIQFLNAYILNGGGSDDENLVIYGWIRELTYGVMMQLHLFYDVLEGNSWVTHRQEMPAARVVFLDGSRVYFFPVMRRRQTSGIIKDKEENEMFVFDKKAYFEKVGEILSRYPVGTVHIKRALVVLTQVDRDLYAYSKRVNGWEDPFSIRTDLPDYSNISGGHGIFGALVEDSVFVEITAW
jgi:hypothetical protein